MYPQYDYDRKLVSCVPSPRQLMHARMEFYGFICFNMVTFTDRDVPIIYTQTSNCLCHSLCK